MGEHLIGNLMCDKDGPFAKIHVGVILLHQIQADAYGMWATTPTYLVGCAAIGISDS